MDRWTEDRLTPLPLGGPAKGPRWLSSTDVPAEQLEDRVSPPEACTVSLEASVFNPNPYSFSFKPPLPETDVGAACGRPAKEIRAQSVACASLASSRSRGSLLALETKHLDVIEKRHLQYFIYSFNSISKLVFSKNNFSIK